MPSADLLIPFFVASAIFACVPGPGMFYAAAQTLALGRRAGWYSALGFHLAGFGHIAAAAFGLSVLLQIVPGLFTAMKLVGAAYLVWLGIKYLRRPPPIATMHATSASLTAGKALRGSVVVEALNPKSVLFYLAFLPQFTDPSEEFAIWTQVIVLGAVVNAMFTVTDAILIEMSHSVMRRLKSSARIARNFQRIGGGILVALGLNLAVARQ